MPATDRAAPLSKFWQVLLAPPISDEIAIDRPGQVIGAGQAERPAPLPQSADLSEELEASNATVPH